MSALVSDIQAPAVPLIKTRSGRYRLNQKDMSSWPVSYTHLTDLSASGSDA